MNTKINEIENELFIGLAGGLGVNFNLVSKQLTKALELAGYHVEEVRIATFFEKPKTANKFGDYYWKMQYGTNARKKNGNDYWAKCAIQKIFNDRKEISNKHKKIAYIIRSLKNREELELFSTVYGRNFISISIFSEQEQSIKYLSRKLGLSKVIANRANEQIRKINQDLLLGDDIKIENVAQFLIAKDQEETHPQLKPYGQNLYKCFSNAHYFIYQNHDLKHQVDRFIKLLFSDPFAEPDKKEYFMFCAQAAAYRSLDPDRQVGAAIVKDNEVIALGYNDVFKVKGGHDRRDFIIGEDFNHHELDKIAHRISAKFNLQNIDQIRDEIAEITEFKRSTHAEMASLLSAAKRGVAVDGCTMYVNTFPCHNCTKHIIAAGIKKVVFLHPYPKSKAEKMYADMIEVGINIDKQGVLAFEPFLGVSPNKYMSVFANDKETRLEKVNGKETGMVRKWQIDVKSIPENLRCRRPHSYITRELEVIFNKIPDIDKLL